MSKTTVDMICFCGNPYTAKIADLKRGWGKSCSKSCAALRRKYHKPNPEFVNKEEAFNIKGGGKSRKARKKSPVDNRYEERRAERERIAKQCGYYPFDSEEDMYTSMCDNPIEGR